jgi:cellulose biosynthesis protein BcsQ
LKLREGLDLLPSTYRWIFMDVPHQLDNIAQLGLIAADYVILPLELTEDCLERLDTVLSIYEESRIHNPRLRIIGGLPLALAPRRDRHLAISAKEEDIYHAYRDALAPYRVPLFKTVMYLSAKHSVEEARINASFRLMHWTAQRRYRRFFAEVVAAVSPVSLASPHSHARSKRKRAYAKTPASA